MEGGIRPGATSQGAAVMQSSIRTKTSCLAMTKMRNCSTFAEDEVKKSGIGRRLGVFFGTIGIRERGVWSSILYERFLLYVCASIAIYLSFHST